MYPPAIAASKTKTVVAEIMEDSESIRNRLQDDFPNIVFTRNGFSLKVSINDAFFSRLTAYGSQIKIGDREIADQYISFLNKIITRNSPERRSS